MRRAGEKEERERERKRESSGTAPESSRVTVDPIFFFPFRGAAGVDTRRVPELKLIPATAVTGAGRARARERRRGGQWI